MSPHYTEALIAGLLTGVPTLVITLVVSLLTWRDTRTKLILKTEQHDKDLSAHSERLDKHEEVIQEHGQRIVRLETGMEHGWGRR